VGSGVIVLAATPSQTPSQEAVMKLSHLALGMVLAAASTGAQAQNYPWCAHYDFGWDDAVNCGFVSFDQCMQTVRGMGGFCITNSDPPMTPAPHHGHKHSSRNQS
jgi:hypothetical protein